MTFLASASLAAVLLVSVYTMPLSMLASRIDRWFFGASLGVADE